MYFLIRNTTLDTKMHMFQCKVLHNILYVNKMLFKFGKVKDVYIYSFGFLSRQFYLILCLTRCNTKFVFFFFVLFYFFISVRYLLKEKKWFFNAKVISPWCSFCKLHDQTIMHLFYACLVAKRIWSQLKSVLSNNLFFPISTPQTIIFVFWDLDTNEHLIHSHKK